MHEPWCKWTVWHYAHHNLTTPYWTLTGKSANPDASLTTHHHHHSFLWFNFRLQNEPVVIHHRVHRSTSFSTFSLSFSFLALFNLLYLPSWLAASHTFSLIFLFTSLVSPTPLCFSFSLYPDSLITTHTLTHTHASCLSPASQPVKTDGHPARARVCLRFLPS